ncbi:zinc-binding dehydrogenase [Jiangella mangrovi]|uniref:NADPH:quinone reductase-like Zn-dependent oxidoreductase n=1 Tax=Jiangella mangrovi TaxID=1524084 RepID=A0A7W9LJ55_9ACTN|nr:zinc-binding dehydrogenase [Jiangella mangrovi]MBB5785756.1 NADPH:quinone reductase-like Zn-dependent oxidoreductase [Jiangella mangrovi]
MFAAYASALDADDPLSGLTVGERPEPSVPGDWTTVTVRATALNHHDLWSLRGVGLDEKRLPMILGCDAAGVTDDGAEVLVHAVVSDPDWRDDETLDPKRSLLSERFQGTFAERVAVPRRNLVPKPSALSFEEAACLPTAWLTAYRMLFTQAQVVPGQTVLVQGAGGGVATALVALGAAAGARMWVTSRDPERASRVLSLGAAEVFGSGERLPARVDAVMETVGEATWQHSLRSLRPGGTVVVSGATSGYAAPTELNRVFFLQLRVLGSTMGTRDELVRLLAFCERTGLRPPIHQVLPLAQARDGFAALENGDVFGKVVFTP